MRPAAGWEERRRPGSTCGPSAERVLPGVAGALRAAVSAAGGQPVLSAWVGSARDRRGGGGVLKPIPAGPMSASPLALGSVCTTVETADSSLDSRWGFKKPRLFEGCAQQSETPASKRAHGNQESRQARHKRTTMCADLGEDVYDLVPCARITTRA